MPMSGFLRNNRVLFTIRYAFDWILAIAFIIAAAFLGNIDGARRPFDPFTPDYSYPNAPDTVTDTTLGLVAVVAPALITLIACLAAPKFALPAIADHPNASKSIVWKHKLLNWNRAWLSLALSVGLAFFVTQGMKNVIGKPRPHMLAVCEPDWEKVAQIVRTTRTGPSGILAWNPIVRAEDICTTTDNKAMAEAFRSFPSGHTSLSFAGLTYLSLFMYSTLVLTLTTTSSEKLPLHHNNSRGRRRSSIHELRASRILPPSLPLISFVIVIMFFLLATWIGCSRYLDFHHAGIDIFAGACVGFFSALMGSWWYAMPAAGGVAKGRMRSGYRAAIEHSKGGASDDRASGEYLEPRGPLGASETLRRKSSEEPSENTGERTAEV